MVAVDKENGRRYERAVATEEEMDWWTSITRRESIPELF